VLFYISIWYISKRIVWLLSESKFYEHVGENMIEVFEKEARKTKIAI